MIWEVLMLNVSFLGPEVCYSGEGWDDGVR